MKQILLIILVFSALSVLGLSLFNDQQVSATSHQTVDVVISFNPNPVIFEDPFEILMMFKNPETGEIVKDVAFATRTNFGSLKHSNIQERTVSADGNARTIAILTDDCCTGWNFEITVFGLEGREVPTQTILIPLKVELEETDSDDIPQRVREDAGKWAGKQIDDLAYANHLEYLMDKGFLNANHIPSEFPDSLRQKAGNWFHGSISDQQYFEILNDFLSDGTAEPKKTPAEPKKTPDLIVGAPSETETTVSGISEDGKLRAEIIASNPISDEIMTLEIKFRDSTGSVQQHANYDLLVSQAGKEILSVIGAHEHNGIGMHSTASLDSDDQVDIKVTVLGFGLPDDKDNWSGPKGEILMFNVVPEFGTITAMILAIAMISIIMVSAKSKLSIIPRM